MSQKKAKAIRRQMRKNAKRIVLRSLEQTLDEPFAERLRTAMRIAAGRSVLLYYLLRASLLLVAGMIYYLIHISI